MKHPIRTFKAWVAWRVLKRAVNRLPEDQKELIMENVKKWWESRGQLTKLLTAVLTAVAATGFMPDWMPLFGKLTDAIQAGEPVAVIGALFGIAGALWSFFDRDRKEKQHAELVEVTAKK